MAKLSLLSDEAIGEAHTDTTDGLGFTTYAGVLSQAAIETAGPFTIGIFGEWGTGKTSLMQMVKARLADRDNVITVWFNAWRYEQEEHPIVPLVGTIVRELERHKSFKQRLKDGGEALVRSLRAIAYGFSAKSKVKVPGLAEIEASFVAKDAIEREEKLALDPLLDRSLYYQAYEALSQVDLGKDTRIIVLIDDLDRCFPDQAIRLLESIKLVLSQPGFIFVLGVARRVIEGYLQHRYQSEYGIVDFQGQLYLDKMVQLSFYIPPHAGRMEKFSNTTLARLPTDVASRLKEILPLIGEALGGNPRSVIRFVNNILIDLAISTDLAVTSEIGEIPVEYFAISRCLQQRWPNVFSLLVSSDELADSVATWDRDQIRENASSKDEGRASMGAALISDRDLQALLLADHGKAWLTNPALRGATVSFLKSQRRETQRDKGEHRIANDAYISYAHADRAAASQIAEILADGGLKVFLDTKLELGADWAKTLHGALEESHAICFLISPASSQSTYMLAELKTAIELRGDRKDFLVVPILLPGSQASMVPSPLERYQWLDLSDGITPDKLQRLVNTLKH